MKGTVQFLQELQEITGKYLQSNVQNIVYVQDSYQDRDPAINK